VFSVVFDMETGSMQSKVGKEKGGDENLQKSNKNKTMIRKDDTKKTAMRSPLNSRGVQSTPG